MKVVKPVVLNTKIVDLDADGTRIVVLNRVDASNIGVSSYERVRLMRGDKSITALVLVTDTIVERGVIGMPPYVASELDADNGMNISVKAAGIPSSMRYVLRKLKGEKLSGEEIRQIVKDAIDGNLGDVELATFLLSEYFYGMDGEELESLVRAMVDTGSVIEFEETVYDEHSIGGVPGNSKVALIAVPTVAYAGLLIPKTSSRAITSPAGTADTMEVLARVDFTPEEIKEIALKTKGLIAWGGALNMAPADDIFIRVLQRIMLDPYMQMVASILSKKLAMNVSNLVIDIPVGRGAKVTSMETAMKIANLFVYQGERLGIKVKCAISYGGQPVGYSIGPALEAKEALETLMGKGPMSVLEKAAGIAGILFEVAGVVPRGKGAYLAKDLIKSGKSLEKMREIIEAQGGYPNVKPEDIPVGEKVVTIESPSDGYVTHVDNAAITLIARAAGAPHARGAGVKIHVKAGRKIKSGDPLLTIYAESSLRLSQAHAMAMRLKPVKIEGMILRVYPEK